eukprot:6197527-Pleurochrysis_carterae.AAC.5
MGAPVWRPALLPYGVARSGAARCKNGSGGLPLSASDARRIWELKCADRGLVAVSRAMNLR